MEDQQYRDEGPWRPERQPLHERIGVWRTTHRLWDKVLYGIGTAYDKTLGKR